MMATDSRGKAPRVVALCGGIGGAKLALGLHRILDPGQLAIVVNTGDDFEHLGLHISPDLDTVFYTLSGLSDLERGWGRSGETWNLMATLREFGGPDWFLLGDRDIGIHILRTQSLRSGDSLTRFSQSMTQRLGIGSALLPMSDDPVRTVVETPEGDMAFQQYFVARRCEPVLKGLRFEGAREARITPEVAAALASPELEAIIVCPSNPYLSIDPILAVSDMRSALLQAKAPIVAVSPIIGGQAVKGPTAKIMKELGVAGTNAAIAAHYRGLIDGLVIDSTDAHDRRDINIAVEVMPTLMRDLSDRERLAQGVLDFARNLQRAPRKRPSA
jgi:LPPG:FO 2-phospho-L-lactate transferase